MNITKIASALDWRGNNKGVWKALVKDMTPNSTVTFGNGYTATVSGRTVSVTNATSPVGTMTYDSELTNAVNTAPLYGAGNISDSLEAVAGDRTVRMGSVDLGTLEWTYDSTNHRFYSSGIASLVKHPDTWTDNLVCDDYLAFNGSIGSPTSVMTSDKKISIYTSGSIYLTNFAYTDPTVFRAAMSGVMLYYELAEPTTSTETPQSLSLTTGDDTLSGGSFDATYEGTDYSIPLIRNCKYIYRDGEGNETLLTGSTTNTSIDVKGGESKLVNLTHWFGRNREPSIEDFYKLYPTWKTYDIPYNQGSVLNYKGTGIETIGFNAYNHSTGTASLLGGNKYQICGTYTSVSYVDEFGNAEEITLDANGIFTPVGNGTLTVTGGNGTDTCVHLVWSGYKNYGEPEYKWEPFISNVKEFPISTYFPEGMNGIRSVSDELTSEQTIQRIGVIDLGTLTYNDYNNTQNTTYPYGYVSFVLSSKAGGKGNLISPRYVTSVSDGFVLDKSVLGTDSNSTCYIVNSDFIGMTGVQIKAALSGVLCYYELATPVITQIDQPLNLAYPVNDFGTEQSLPVNTTDLVTTDLKALIKYNTDYMRMNSQLSGIFPTVKSLVQQEQDGHIMKKDDTAPKAIVGGAYNLIDRNAEGTERQFSYDTAGGLQDITDGTAVAKKSMGTTLNLNQLVHDDNQNVVTGEGQVEVEDAVVGDVTSLVVEGRSLVRNQLVPPSLEETEDSTNGMIEVSDAVVGNAKGLVMTAPRSVVVNQLVQNGDFSDDFANWTKNNVSTAVSNNICTVTYNAADQYKRITQKVDLIAGHVYARTCEFVSSGLPNEYAMFGGNGLSNVKAIQDATGWVRYFSKDTATSTNLVDLHYSLCNEILSESYSSQIRNIMLVDLTQYFNGDTALIDSITSWDDLVAYDPRFAQYVEYNTGTVEGVQPTVKVTGKNLFDKNAWQTITYNRTGDTINGQNKLINGCYVSAGQTITISLDISGTAPEWVYSGFRMNGHDYIMPEVSNASNSYFPTTTNWMENGVRTLTFTRTGFFYLYKRSGNFASANDANASLPNVQIELGSTATSYEPYHDGGTAQAPSPLFAVGNAADEYKAVAGVTTRKMASVDLGTLNWTYNQSNGLFYSEKINSAAFADVHSVANIICGKYQSASYVTSINIDKTIAGASTTKYVYVHDTSFGTDVVSFKAAMSGVMLYYELATPTASTSTPTQISLQAGTNVVTQTDGGRTVPFSLTYDGTEFTLPLDSTHKYAFSDNGTKSIVTNATEQAVTGGQDMLVDVTRMFNGDTVAINAVTSWNDMAAVMPEYLSNVAYNEGEVVGRSGEVTTARWNQLVQNGNFVNTDGWVGNRVDLSAQNNVLTATLNAGSAASVSIGGNGGGDFTIPAGHIACAVVTLNMPYTTSARIYLRNGNNDVYNSGSKEASAGSDSTVKIKTDALTNDINRIAVYPMYTGYNNYQSGSSFQIKNIQLFDLTAIYGAGHEPSTVEEFEADCLRWGKDLTQYQAYDAGTPMGGSATFSNLHGVGSVVETQNIITGEKDVKIGSVDLGELTWLYNSANGVFWNNTNILDIAKSSSVQLVCDKYAFTTAYYNVMPDKSIRGFLSFATSGVCAVLIRDTSFGSNANAFKTAMSGVMLYYELATPSTTSETPQPLTFSAGLNNVHEEDVNITSTPINMEYTGTDYTIATKSARKYIKTIDGTTELVTGVSSVDVRGGRDNLIDLTRMFGATLEPGTLADFYQLFPAWNGYKLPYNKGSLLNYKGTGLKSVGFNLIDFGGRTLGAPQNTTMTNKTVRGPFDETKYYIGFSGNNFYLPANVTYYSVSATSIAVKVGVASSYGVAFPIRVVPGQTYRIENRKYGIIIAYYTYNGTHISYSADPYSEAPANAYWGLIIYTSPSANTQITYSDPCVHLQWSGTRNGDYEPYWSYTRPVPTLTYFPDGMNGRGQVYDEINPRQAIKRFGKVDLETLTWTWTATGTYGRWTTNGIVSSLKAPSSNSVVAAVISELYTPQDITSFSGNEASLDCMGVATTGTLFVNNGSATEPPTGWLVYELATPVVTSFPEEISATARISDYGTEECLPVNGYDPVTTPFRGMVLYQDDYARTITKLPENYQSQSSMDNLLALIGPLLNGTITATFDSANQVYTYQFTPNA